MDLQQFSDLYICFARYGGALAALCFGVLFIINLCCMAEDRRASRELVFGAIQSFLWACIGFLFFFSSFS